MTVIKTECDDQMVPLGTIEILSSDAGATVIDTQKVLPDFESLFTSTCDLQGTTEFLFPIETSDDCGLKTPDSGVCDMDTQALCTEEALKLIDLEQTIASDDMSFYGNLNYYYPEKMEKDPAMPNYYNEQSQQQQVYSAIYQEEQTQPETEADLEALRREIEYTCAHLQITPDPYSWTPDMTQRWAKYQLEQYVHLPAICPDQFYIDGTSLCMLTKDDLCARFPEHGQYLSPQLDIWKMFVCSMQTSSLVYQEEPAYTIQDLDKVVLPCKVPTAIPTPVITALPTSIPTPMLQPQTCQTMSPSQSVDSLDSPNSSLSSWSSVGSISSADSRTNSPHNRETFKYQSRPSGKHTIHLWQFLKELLLEPQSFSNCIKWIDQRKGIFKIEDSSRVARLWGKRKNRPAMNYDKLSRSIRQYYKKGIIKKTEHSKRLVYQFCPQYL